MAEASNRWKPDSCNSESGEGEDELERLAVEELVNEAKRAKERAQTMGTYGWQKRKATTNKRFLHNTLVSTLRSYDTDSRHRQKRYGHGSRTVEAERSKPITADQNGKSACDAISQEPTRDSRSLGASPDDDHSERRDARPSHLDRSSRRGMESKDSKSKPRDSERTGDYYSHCREKERKHGKRTSSRSPRQKETIAADDNDHSTGHHRHGKRSKRSKHKRKSKHKDKHSRSASQRNSRRHETR